MTMLNKQPAPLLRTGRDVRGGLPLTIALRGGCRTKWLRQRRCPLAEVGASAAERRNVASHGKRRARCCVTTDLERPVGVPDVDECGS